MRFLIDRMHDELNRIVQKPKYQEVDYGKLSLVEQSEKWAEYYKQRD